MKWKVPGWAAAAGAVLSLLIGIAVGNRFGTILLRAVPMAVLAGVVGWAAQYTLRRFLPGSPQPRPGGVDILVDEELPLAAGQKPGEGLGLTSELTGGTPEEELASGVGESAGGMPGVEPDLTPEFDAGEGALEPAEEVEGAEEASGGEALEALPAGEELAELGGEDQGLPSRRSLKAEELEAQLDNVVQGQDPASLAKAVRTFLRKDQEG